MTADRFRHVATAAAAVIVATMISGCGGHASSSRRPTPVERGALQQAIYDHVIAHTAAAKPSITNMRVSTVRVDTGRAAYYTAFAMVAIYAPDAGPAAVFLGRREKGLISGWHVLDLGSAKVGCDFGPKVFGSHKQAVLHSLGLTC